MDIIKPILKQHAYQNIPLWYDQAYELGCIAIEACAPNASNKLQAQTVAMLSALHNRATYHHHGDGRETPINAAEQIAGVCAAIFDHDIAKSKYGFAEPKVPYVMDNCGMGGDLVTTANVSTLAAFIAATAGVNMCKHGSPGNTDRVGSSDFVERVGIKPDMSRKEAEQMVEQYHFAYTEALDTGFKRIHWQTHVYADLPHMNDIIGPITNPVNPKLMTKRVIGVNHLIDPAVVAEAYQILNRKGVTDMHHLIAVRGYIEPGKLAGVDELSICAGGTKMAVLHEGQVSVEHYDAEHFGLETIAAEAISPPAGMTKEEFSLSILHRDTDSPVLDMVLANAALLFILDQGMDPKQAYSAARETYISGDVERLVSRVSEKVPAKEKAAA